MRDSARNRGQRELTKQTAPTPRKKYRIKGISVVVYDRVTRRRSIKKSSIFFPFFIAATRYLGLWPLPAQVSPDGRWAIELAFSLRAFFDGGLIGPPTCRRTAEDFVAAEVDAVIAVRNFCPSRAAPALHPIHRIVRS
jgi:hypothetical protein